MLQVQSYVRAAGWTPITGRIVSEKDARALTPCLLADTNSLYVSAVVTFLDALRGIQVGFYSWSTAKLYYSVFYALRAILAANTHALVYEGVKPRHVEVVPGAECKKLKGTTHEAILKLFGRVLGGHWLLSQEVDLLPPPAWLMKLREQANYRRGHFWEPACPGHFVKFEQLGLRRSVGAYLDEDRFAFDVEHAAVAFPLHTLLHARKGVTSIMEEDADFIEGNSRDATGKFTLLSKKLL